MTSTLVAPHATPRARVPARARARVAAPVTPRPVPARPAKAAPPRPDIVEVWGQDSFPASDAPANW
ncbi:MAG TPA: hypothetical protein VGD39_14455 [Nocardioides sp.]|jgi:hypothetical protein